MADDGQLTGERQRLLDEIDEWNRLLAHLGVATRLPLSAALRCTTAELHIEVRAVKRQYLASRHLLDGI